MSGRELLTSNTGPVSSDCYGCPCNFDSDLFSTVDTGEDGEETKFSTRAKLFHWNGKAWVEGGLGTFKLNVTVLSEDNPDTTLRARFIMRAQQTYRVILNTPVFKQMSIGDSRGQEPTSKAISFAVVEKGRPVPYMVRVSNRKPSFP